MNKFILVLFGIIIASIGLTFIILDLNLLVLHYSFLEYLLYIFTHLSTLSFFIGIIIIYLGIKKYN